MSEYSGYKGDSLAFLQNYKVKVGDSIKVTEDLTYTGILMPRYEHGDDKHIVIKLKSGYNVGIEIQKIKKRIAANPDELEALKIGMDMELESVEFYQTALEKSEDNLQKAFLRRLVEEEKEHLQLLQNTHSYLKNSGDWFLWEEKALLNGG
ncbi:hypothetical protein LCGC14_1922270 [marine sediment metagenome]|uniref:GatD N-terminal domain-containing protein n=1 Tax=marine sediment metagenome TaxID=412755 RepID=A0A0F9FQ72_9ZZZZ